MKRKQTVILVTLLAFALAISACTTGNHAAITASGTLSAVEVSVAPEVAGRVVKIDVTEGQQVKAGDELFSVDSSVAQAQFDQSKAAVDAANATLTAAQSQLNYAQAQRDLAVQGSRAQNSVARQTEWSGNTPDKFQPTWYFQKSERITAAQADVDASLQALTDEQANLQTELKEASNQDFISAEKRLNQAQIAYSNAQATLNLAKTANNQKMTDAAQSDMDAAQSELDAARTAYDKMLNSAAADAVLNARAKVAVAQARYDASLDGLAVLQTGSDSLQVTVAQAGVNQAQAAVDQAKGNLEQAQAAMSLSQLQLNRTTTKAPISGTLIARDVEVGDLAAAGGVVMTIANLDTLNLTVYIPENQYGLIKLGQQVEIKVDSFAGKTFIGSVTSIADAAEYTPRNVQTANSRASTVYAVKISVPNSDAALKPGMPADVTFIEK